MSVCVYYSTISLENVVCTFIYKYVFSRFFFNVGKVLLLVVVSCPRRKKRPELRSSNACQRDTVDVNSRFRNFFLAEDDEDDDGSFVVSSKQLEAS